MYPAATRSHAAASAAGSVHAVERDGSGRSDVARLRDVLADDAVPWPAFFLRSEGETVVAVSAIADLVASRGIDWSEPHLDELVRELGGTRQPIVDPWSWPGRTLRRLRG